MRIGVMLRCLEESGGIAVYAQNLVEELLRLDRKNQYVLFHRRAANLGRFGHHLNLTEQVVRGSNKVYWDQVAIPWSCWRQRTDVILHPKFTAPLMAPCKAVMVVHGADWFLPEQAQYYSWANVTYMRMIMPLYFRKCSAVISVSQLTTDNFKRIFRLPEDRIRTVYFGPGRQFRRVTDDARLEEVRQKYGLPGRFILTLTKRGGAGRKNLGQVFRAYARYYGRATAPQPLVVGGKDCALFRNEFGLPESGYGGAIQFPGWLDQQDLPAVYSLASLYLYPSNLEAFPIPVTEAMACGVPIVTSNANGLEEIAGDACLLTDPADADAIADAMTRVLEDNAFASRLSAKGLERSRQFNWGVCAKKTLEILETLEGESRD